MPNTIDIPARPVITVKVTLVGKEYKVPAPKTTIGLIAAERMQAAGSDTDALIKALHDWVDAVFGTKTGKEVWARLFDPEDPLDIPDVSSLITKLTELGANPTT